MCIEEDIDTSGRVVEKTSSSSVRTLRLVVRVAAVARAFGKSGSKKRYNKSLHGRDLRTYTTPCKKVAKIAGTIDQSSRNTYYTTPVGGEMQSGKTTAVNYAKKMLSSELPFQPIDGQNQGGAPQDLQPGGRSSTAGAHTPRGQWESGGMERMGFDLRAGERLTSALRGTVGCLMSGADR